jgi:hypothetical protein
VRRVGLVAVAVVAVALLTGGLAVVAAASAAKVPVRPIVATPIGLFEFPVQVVAPAGDSRRLFVVEKAGRVRVVLDGRVLAAPFLDLRDEVRAGNEPGLLSLAFSPGYARSGRFYVYLAGTDERTHLYEFRRSVRNPNRADTETRREVLSFEHPSSEHFGGQLLFGPDRRLYLGTGDGGLSEWQDKMRAQRSNDPNGKILRVNLATGAVRVVARGLRNPWRFDIDPETGGLYVGDAGEFVRESIDYAPRSALPGANFGWPCFEGNLPSERFPETMCPGARPPLYEYAREGGNCVVVGGVVVRDPRLQEFAGRYLFADYCLGEIQMLTVRGGELFARRSLRLYLPRITSFGSDAKGRVHLATSRGTVYRLDPSPDVRQQASRESRLRRSGKELFLASGCGTCHVLAAVDTGGTYGPNLDDRKPSRALLVDRITHGANDMPAFRGRLSAAEIQRIADFVAGNT